MCSNSSRSTCGSGNGWSVYTRLRLCMYHRWYWDCTSEYLGSTTAVSFFQCVRRTRSSYVFYVLTCTTSRLTLSVYNTTATASSSSSSQSKSHSCVPYTGLYSVHSRCDTAAVSAVVLCCGRRRTCLSIMLLPIIRDILRDIHCCCLLF